MMSSSKQHNRCNKPSGSWSQSPGDTGTGQLCSHSSCSSSHHGIPPPSLFQLPPSFFCIYAWTSGPTVWTVPCVSLSYLFLSLSTHEFFKGKEPIFLSQPLASQKAISAFWKILASTAQSQIIHRNQSYSSSRD